MKPFLSRAGSIRVGALLAALLFGQHALAAGTDAGTVVTNQASVVYDVGGNTQNPVLSTEATFTVDRIVTFTLVQQDTANTAGVSPGDTNAETLFVLTNTGNSPLDFSLSATNLANGTVVNTETDDSDMDTTFEFLVANGDGVGGVPTAGDLAWVEHLPEGESVVIAVLADAPLTLVDGNVANIELTATAADPGVAADPLVDPNPVSDGSLGANLVASAADGDQAIDVVFNDSGNDGLETAQDGYTISSASLTILKSAVVLDDQLGGTFAIPGAEVEYTLNISNTGSSAATGIVITDTLDSNLILQLGAYDDGGTPVDIELVLDPSGAATTSYCTADAGDADLDGCGYDAGTGVLTIGGSDYNTTNPGAPIDLAAGADMDISFQVVIDAT